MGNIQNSIQPQISFADLKLRGRKILSLLSIGKLSELQITHNGKIIGLLAPFRGAFNLTESSQIISAAEFQRSGKRLFEKLCSSNLKQFLVMKSDRPVGVLISIDYDSCTSEMDQVIYDLDVLLRKSGH